MRFLLLIPLFLLSIYANGQNGTKFLSAKGGYGINEVYSGGLAYEYSTKYFGLNEIFFEYQDRPSTSYYTVLGGFGLKPVIARASNTAFRLRAGVSIGSDFTKFIAAPHGGFEISQTLYPRIDLFVGNKSQILLWAPSSERWRFIFDLGMRIPLN